MQFEQVFYRFKQNGLNFVSLIWTIFATFFWKVGIPFNKSRQFLNYAWTPENIVTLTRKNDTNYTLYGLSEGKEGKI